MTSRTLRRRALASSLALLLSLGASPDARAGDAPRVEPPRLVERAEPAPVPTSERVVVVVTLDLDEGGRVTATAIAESGGAAFDAAALDAARALVFAPARRDGVAVASRVPFRFTFEPALPTSSPSEPPAAEPAAAEPAVPAPPVPDGESAIEIQGARAPREPTVRTLDATEVRRVPGANGDPLRALESLPGVARAPAPGGALIVRGSAPQDTWVGVDGTWVPYAYHFGGVASVIPGDVLEKLEYRPGNFGPEYGRAMGGVVEMKLRSPRKDRLGGLAQVDLLDGRLLAEGPLGERTRFLVAGRRSWVDAWLGPVLRGSGAGVTTAPRYLDGQLVLEHDLSDRTTARLAFFGGDDRLAILLNAPDASDPGLGGALASRVSFTRLQARLTSRLAEGLRLETTAAWGTDSSSFSGGDDRVETMIHTGQLRTDLRGRISERVVASAGLDVLYAYYDVTLLLPGATGLDDPATGPLFAAPRRKLEGAAHVVRPAAYTQLEVTPLRGLVVLPGLRVDASSENRRLTADPRVAARWDVGGDVHRTTVKGGLGVFHQPPLNESLEPWGDRNVRAMRAVHASLGVEQSVGRTLDLSAEGFAKELSELIVPRAAEASTTSGVAYVNTGEGTVRGVELLAKLHPEGGPLRRFSGWVAYTLSRSERRDAPDEPSYRFRYDQTHVLSALGSVDLGRGFTFGARYRYVTGTPTTPYVGGVVDLDAGAYQPVQGARASARLPDFHRLDLRIEKTWRLGLARLSAYLDVQNVTNAKNPEGLVYRYDYSRSAPASGLPVLPILGLRGEL